MQQAEELDRHRTVKRFAALAKELGVVLPVSVFERAGTAHYNTTVIVDADGRELGIYRKSHIPDGRGYQEKFYFSPGDTGFKVWDTAVGRIGLGICWDQWFPECARAMALMGAEILLYPTAIGSEPPNPDYDSSTHWQNTMRGHAAANIMPLMASNRVGKETAPDGRSDIFYGRSFIADYQGEKVEEMDRTRRGRARGELRHGHDPRAAPHMGRVPRPEARTLWCADDARRQDEERGGHLPITASRRQDAVADAVTLTSPHKESRSAAENPA